jgi:hypothetical protein
VPVQPVRGRRRRRPLDQLLRVVELHSHLLSPMNGAQHGDATLPLRGAIAFPARVFHQNFYRLIARRDHVEVGALSRGVTFKPLSEPLQPGIRLLHDPLPAPPTASLTIGLPTSRTTSSAAIRAYPVPYPRHEQRRSCLSTGGTTVDVSHSAQRQPAAYRLVRAYFAAIAQL